MQEVKEVTAKRVTIVNRYGGPGGGAYFLGFIGVFIYYMQSAATFGEGVVGFLKALVWPAILVYNLFKYLGL